MPSTRYWYQWNWRPSPFWHTHTQMDAAKAFGDALAHNCKLTRVKAEACFSTDGVKEFLVGVGVNRSITRLGISECRLGKAGWVALGDTILQNRTLREIAARDTGCDSKIFEEMLEQIETRKYAILLRLLDISQNKVDLDRVQQRLRDCPIKIIFDKDKRNTPYWASGGPAWDWSTTGEYIYICFVLSLFCVCILFPIGSFQI